MSAPWEPVSCQTNRISSDTDPPFCCEDGTVSSVDVPDLPVLRVGCPMWAHKSWVGTYFPADTPSGEELGVYQSWCETVEGNTTFYAEPSADSVARWFQQTSETFRFCLKLPRTITHERRLRNVENELNSFLHTIEPLGQRLGPIQVQLPASFGPADMAVLEGFLRAVPSSFTWAVEVRNPEFFVGGTKERPLNDLLASLGINRVTLDSRALFASPAVTDIEIETWESKPRLPVRPVATASEPIVRLIGQTDLQASLDHWQPWIPKIADWLRSGLHPHVFTHTPDNKQAPELARRFWALVAEELPELQPLPTPRTAGTQLGFELDPKQ